MSKVYVGDTGTLIRFMFRDPLPSGASASIEYKKPNGTTGSWPATITTGDPPYAHYVDYVTQANDLDERGPWKLQVKIVSPSWSGRSDTAELVVLDPFG